MTERKHTGTELGNAMVSEGADLGDGGRGKWWNAAVEVKEGRLRSVLLAVPSVRWNSPELEAPVFTAFSKFRQRSDSLLRRC